MLISLITLKSAIVKVLNSINQLCEDYGSDKCPRLGHSYAPFYDALFYPRRNIKRLLEIGAGSYSCMGRYMKWYIPCASLYVWRDYFKKAIIYGIDIDESCLINEDRIHVEICDQNDEKQLKSFIKRNDLRNKLEIIIDDGSHKLGHQINSAHTLMPYLKEGGIYCIEDVRKPEALLEVFGNYNCKVYEFNREGDNCIITLE